MFSYACSLPFLSVPRDAANSSLFGSALATSVALAREGNGVPLLHVTTGNKNYNASLAGDIEAALCDMARIAARSSIEFAVENAMLKWSSFWQLLRNATLFVPPTPLLVFEACNLAWVSDGADGPKAALMAAGLQIGENTTVLLHAKQVAAPGGPILSAVGPGVMDWSALSGCRKCRCCSRWPRPWDCGTTCSRALLT